MTSRRDLRWNDFRRRADHAPDSVYRHSISGWAYIPIHPFADEPELLSRLGLRPEDCRAVDAWWCLEGDATLLQTQASRPSAFYAQGTGNDEHWVYLRAILGVPYITRVAFESTMTHFAELGFPANDLFQLPPNKAINLTRGQ
jgi:hypothetical protein